MNFNNVRFGFLAIAFGIAGNGLFSTSAHAEDYSFKAKNTTKTAITEILVSENKREWGHFDVGNGIRPGKTVDLVWDQSTNSESCAQWVKATYADGSESEPAKFDFCESDLAIDF